MRVRVTGHMGYIGTVMVPMLLQAGHVEYIYIRSWRDQFVVPIPDVKVYS